MVLPSHRSSVAAAFVTTAALGALVAPPPVQAEPTAAYPLYAEMGSAVSAAAETANDTAISASSDEGDATDALPAATEIGAPAGASSPDDAVAEALPCEPATSELIDAVLRRLDERRSYARVWWMGFTGFYGLGTLVTAYQAAEEDDAGKRAVDIVSSVKAAFGTTRLLFDRPAALYGGVPVRKELPTATPRSPKAKS